MSLEPEARSRLDSKGRVHFLESQVTPDHAGQILVELHEDHADAHLGFLQINRKYGLHLTIPTFLGDNIALKALNPNLHLTGSKTTADKAKHILDMELIAHKAGLQNEELELRCDGKEQEFTLTLSARVLGKGKGTPMLKSGLHLLGEVHADGDSTASEASQPPPN